MDNLMDNLMNTMSYGKAAMRKFGAVPEGFQVFSAEWLGENPEDWKTMRVTGAEFKGARRVAGSTMSTIITREEMLACDDTATPALTGPSIDPLSAAEPVRPTRGRNRP